MPTALAELGLVVLGMSVSVKTSGDGGADEVMYRMTMAQARSELVSRRLLSEAEYATAMTLLDDPAVIDAPIANVTAWAATSIALLSVIFFRGAALASTHRRRVDMARLRRELGLTPVPRFTSGTRSTRKEGPALGFGMVRR